MRIIISIVSHGHQADLMQSGLLQSLAKLPVALRENLPDQAKQLSGLAAYYYQNLRPHGFGTNHNRNFEALCLADDDWFVICNPDVHATAQQVQDLVERAGRDGETIAVPYLYNASVGHFDHNVRPWPTFVGLMLAFLKLGGKSRYRESEINAICYPNWASGAFMAIRADSFRALNGFDESYFMYMEDVDLCRRAAQLGLRVRFYPDVCIVHNAARASRQLFSSSLRQHLVSAGRYFLRYRLIL